MSGLTGWKLTAMAKGRSETIAQTLLLAGTSHLGLLRYMILAWQKPLAL